MSTTENVDNIEKEIGNCNNASEVEMILKKYANTELKNKVLGMAFEKMYVKSEGFSASISMKTLSKLHRLFLTTNGSAWSRSNQSYLGKKYNLEKQYAQGKIIEIKADGFNKSLTINQSIRSDILKDVQSQRCAVLDISTNIECDHKDGMKDDWRLNDKSKQNDSDFQPLCKTVNIAKRQHCKKCQETGLRYDATKLGYTEPYTFGGKTTKTCVGCYWYDPIKFNSEISKDFKKSDG